MLPVRSPGVAHITTHAIECIHSFALRFRPAEHRHPRFEPKERDRWATSGSASTSGARRATGRLPRGGRAGRPARLRPRLDVGPHLRDLRRPLPADLRGLHGPRGARPGHRTRPPGPVRRREHVPESRAGGQGADDHRPHQRRSGDHGHRRSVVRGRAHGVRARLRERVRAAPRLAGGSGRRDPRAARRRRGDEPAGRPLRLRPPAHLARCRSRRTCR